MTSRRALVALLVLLALASPAMAAPSPEDRAAIGAVEAYLNGLSTLAAKFTQFAPDGGVAEGQFHLSRPGKLRFQYAPPSPLLVVSDGYWLTLVDYEVRQMNRWPLADTPMAILARKTVDLERDVEILGVERSGGVIRLTVRDKHEPGRGRMTLVFTAAPLQLRQWRVTDAQGLETTVTLSEAVENGSVDPALFTYVDPRPNRPPRGGRKR